MSLINRLRLIAGVLFVVGLLASLVVYLNYSMAHVSSATAKLLSEQYAVGTDYSGIIIKQYVTEGQRVAVGDQLFLIKSSVLDGDLRAGTITKDDIAYSVDSENNIILKSTGTGTVSQIDFLEGSFVPANKEIASITKAGSLYVEANYNLSPPDYARVTSGDIVKVTLPNNQKVDASVFDISVKSSEGAAETVVKARIIGLGSNSTFTAGTPVSTQLQLNGKTLYNTLNETFKDILKPKG